MRFFLLGVGVLAVSGCAAPGWSDLMGSSATAPPAPLAATPDFGWRLSGDRRVAPLQVFDDGRDVWLQFNAGQAVPAIFARSASATVAVSYRLQPPYVVVSGHWPRLVFQGGALRAYAERSGTDAPAERGLAATRVEPSDGNDRTTGRTGAALVAQHGTASSTPVDDRASAGSERAVAALEANGASHALATGRSGDAALSASAAPRGALRVDGGFRIGPEDGTLRGGLARWARTAGWTFDPQHWAVDVDIPVAGSAHFEGDFKTAVRALLDATTLAERPVQPCFYSNQVLRVVPHARACQPGASMGDAA